METSELSGHVPGSQPSFLVRTRHPDLIPLKHFKFLLFVFVNVT